MLVLVSFVLVLAAAVTLVVGLLQSGLTLIYLSIGCSVLAGIVLAVAVLRGRPEPKAAAPVGRPYTPPVSAPPVPAAAYPAAYGASTDAAAPTTSFTPPPPAPPPAPRPAPAPVSDDVATKAAGTALLGRLRGRRDAPVADAPAVEVAPVAEDRPEPVTASMPLIVTDVSDEEDDGFPIANYDQLRATDLLRQLSPLDRNQLEAVRDRETAGKNRFTILSRVDTLLEAQSEPAWEVADDDWEDDADAPTSIIEVGPTDDVADDFEDDDDDFAVGEIEDDEADEVDEFAAGDLDLDEVDELVSPVDDFPIAGYESLTVGQILPRLSDLDAGELAQVRAREQQGRARGTILDRVDRLASKSAPLAMPAAAAPPRRAYTRKAVPPAPPVAAPRKARASKAAIPVPPATSTTPMKEAVKKAAAASKASTRATPARKAAAIPVPTAPVTKAPSRKKAAAPVVTPTPTPRRSTSRKAAAPVVPETTENPMKAAVKKARAAKKRP